MLFRLYEHPLFDIATYYTEILKTMLFMAFYATATPFGVLITIIHLVSLYWIYKV